MKHERTPASVGTSTEPASPASAPSVGARPYEPPAVLWEQPFVALAQTSGDYSCPIPGSCEEIP
jgi:hypothetical protein